MKNIVLIFAFIPLMIWGQDTTTKDNKPVSKQSSQSELDELKTILKGINGVFLEAPLKNKYTEAYFKSTTFKDLETAGEEKLKNSELIIQSFLAVESPNSESYKLAQKALNFNNAYRALTPLFKESLLEKKYDEKSIQIAIEKLEKVKGLEADWALDKERIALIQDLKSYENQNCEAFQLFEKLHTAMISLKNINADQKTIDNELKKYNHIDKKYVFLQKTFNAIKSDFNNYDKEEYKLPDTCKKEAVQPIESETVVEIEEVKEETKVETKVETTSKEEPNSKEKKKEK